jgi:ACDE family multidrug resistance protein
MTGSSPEGADERTLWRDPNLRIVFAITLMAIMGVSSISPVFPAIVSALHVSPRRVGLLITVFTLPGVLLAPFLGMLADRYGRKRILVPALFLFGLAGAACSLMRDFHALLVFRFIQGIGAASLGALYATLVGDLFEGRERTEAMGLNASVLNVGTAGYPVLGGALSGLGWYVPFALPILAVPVGLLVIFRLHNPEVRNRQPLREYLGGVRDLLTDGRILALFGSSVATFVILYGSYMTYFPFLIDHRFGGGSFEIGLIMSTMSGSTAVVSAFVGRLAARYSERRLLTVSLGLLGLGMILVPFVRSVWLLLVPTVVFGIGMGLDIPNVLTLLAGLAPAERRGALLAVNGMVLRLGQTMGPLVMSALFGFWGLDGVFGAGAVLGIAMFGVLSAVLR